MVDYYHSAEARWFSTTTDLLSTWLTWFSRNGRLKVVKSATKTAVTGPHIKRERLRKDEYLILPCSESTGVKQRQGRFEIKSLVSAPRPWSGYGMVGRIDQWVKWSFDPPDDEFRIQLAERLTGKQKSPGSGNWRTVTKTRYLQKYSYDEGSLREISPDHRPTKGCNVELTRIAVNASQSNWITLGFESFGEPGSVLQQLDASLQYYFTNHKLPPHPLTGANSLNYPTWIALLD